MTFLDLIFLHSFFDRRDDFYLTVGIVHTARIPLID